LVDHVEFSNLLCPSSPIDQCWNHLHKELTDDDEIKLLLFIMKSSVLFLCSVAC